MPDAFIYDNPDVVFMGINKIASTTILNTLGYNQNDGKMQVKKGALGLPRFKQSYNHKKNISYYRELLPSHFIFAFVRNPYDRIVSYFEWNKRHNPSIPDFPEFLKSRIASPNFFKGDFKLQTFSIDDPMKCDFIGRFENFSSDFNKVMKIIGIEFEGLKLWINKTKHGRYQEYYTSPDLIDIVTKKFKKDIETFNYTYES